MQGPSIFEERPGKAEGHRGLSFCDWLALCKNPKTGTISSIILHGYVSSCPLPVTPIEQSVDESVAFFPLAL